MARTSPSEARRPARAASRAADPLQRYRAKRDFARTPEPEGVHATPARERSFVIQKHAATRLHYDFRLELDGVLLSWAVPKGPSFDPADKRMAVRTEDHPLSYASFEGTIPRGQYGAGTVIVWDRGSWSPVGDPREGLAQGKLVFDLHGQKLAGRWELVRIRKPGEERQDPWILFKKRDAHARPRAEYDVVSALPDSVVAKPLAPPPALAAPKPRARPRQADAAAAEALPGARRAALPAHLSPQLATLASAVPAAGDWLCEIKFDGYRVLTRVEGGKARLYTRNGHDWSDKMPELMAELTTLPLRSGWLDGEVMVIGEDGTPDFNALQNAFDGRRSAALAYYLFDLPFLDGQDLREVPLAARRARLQGLLAQHEGERVRFSDSFPGAPAGVLQAACRTGLEGIIAKRADAPYRSTRTDTWLKLKCQQRQEFVIGGFTDRANAEGEIGSLLLGVHDADGRLRFVGSVGTGWDSATARDLHRRLARIPAEAAPFADGDAAKRGRWSRRAPGSERWVRPRLVAEVAFGDWTPAGQIRHASFVGLRTDKPPREITRERAAEPPSGDAEPKSASAAARRAGASVATAAKAAPAGVKVTNPQRVIDPQSGLTKLDLVRYYDSVADWILPHLKGRPVALVRGPTGITGQLFFQKHGEKIGIPGIKELDPALWPGHDALLEIDSKEALLGAAQMNTVEFHTWNSTSRNLDRPNRMVFDLDPGEGVGWKQVQEGAQLVHALLEELGLQAWLKTSGGKGLHVVVPIAPRWSYDAVKDLSQTMVAHLARTLPDRFVAKSGASNRVGRIFVDYLRNGFGATTATAFSARARPGLGVSMPVAWEQLPQLKGGAQWTVATAREHLSFQREDPWAGYAAARQSIVGAARRLGFKLPAAAASAAARAGG